jgi:glutamate/tyrosine decarboxylase-like PLP-dependent enzyme
METERLLRRTADLAVDYLESVTERHVGPTATRDEMLAILGGELPPRGDDPQSVVDRLVEAAERGVSGIAGPRYFGYVIGGSLPAALAADWLTATWDQNAGIHSISPAASVAEEVAGEWLKRLLNLPAGASFGFTTGCQMAHVTCLAAARHAILDRAGWDVEGRGLIGAPAVTILAGEEAHTTIFAALQYMGLGRDTAIRIANDEQGRMKNDALAAALPAAEGPLIVCLQAGNVNTGSFDPLGEAIAIIRERRPDAWIHVDGAFGLWAAASPATRHLLSGAERADSWATDGHKWLNVPYDAGYAFVADPAAHRAAMAPPTAAYVPESVAERDESWWVAEYSRRARGFATWAALRSLGVEGVRDLVERCCSHARRFAEQLQVADGVDILNEVVLNQVLVRFDHDDEVTRGVIERVQQDGTLWLSGTTWHGMAAMRISVSNWSTTEADVDRSVGAILEAHHAVR